MFLDAVFLFDFLRGGTSRWSYLTVPLTPSFTHFALLDESFLRVDLDKFALLILPRSVALSLSK